MKGKSKDLLGTAYIPQVFTWALDFATVIVEAILEDQEDTERGTVDSVIQAEGKCWGGGLHKEQAVSARWLGVDSSPSHLVHILTQTFLEAFRGPCSGCINSLALTVSRGTWDWVSLTVLPSSWAVMEKKCDVAAETSQVSQQQQ